MEQMNKTWPEWKLIQFLNKRVYVYITEQDYYTVELVATDMGNGMLFSYVDLMYTPTLTWWHEKFQMN